MVVVRELWDETTFPPDVMEAIDEGMEDAITDLLRAASSQADPPTPDGWLSRTATDQDYFARAAGAVQHSHVAESSG